MSSITDRHSPRVRQIVPAAVGAGGGPRTVLVAIDPSSSAAHAAIYGAGLARRSGASLLLVHVARPPVIWPDLGVDLSDYVEACRHPAPAVLELASSISRELGVDTELIVTGGSPAREITRIANDRHVDLVVAGCPHSLLHRLAGSVSARLVRRNSWPVVTVP